MFKQRLLTTLVLVPLVLFAIYYANTWVLGTVVLLIMLACGMEWLQLIPLTKPTHKILCIMALVLLLIPCYYFLNIWLWGNLAVWSLLAIAIVTFPRSQAYWGHPAVVAFLCFLMLPLFARTLGALYEQEKGADLLVYLLCLVWAADIGAYLAGKRFGQHKLIAKVSPGKTYEGVLGGIFFVLIVAVVGFYYFEPTSGLLWFLMALAVAFISILGDLFFSMLKRRVKLKDAGSLIPGHGGLLDRLDSLIAALPLFYILLQHNRIFILS